jgi:hypothetical protein
MGFSATVQWWMRVAAFAAIATLLFQVACKIGPPAFATVQIDTPDSLGCHESEPATPDTPSSGHICCSGNHSPDALLSGAITPAQMSLADNVPLATFIIAPVRYSTETFVSFSHPPGPLVLRI